MLGLGSIEERRSMFNILRLFMQSVKIEITKEKFLGGRMKRSVSLLVLLSVIITLVPIDVFGSYISHKIQ